MRESKNLFINGGGSHSLGLKRSIQVQSPEGKIPRKMFRNPKEASTYVQNNILKGR